MPAPRGDVFVSDGHSGQNADPAEGRAGRIIKFSADAEYITELGG